MSSRVDSDRSPVRPFIGGWRGWPDALPGIYALLAAVNALAWGWALVEFAGRPALLGTALLAYALGLRHAVDADHIAAIDNVVRKLMHEGRRPLSVGLYFSLGHSTIVVLATAAIAATTAALQDRLDAFKSVGGALGTAISAFFLLAIGIVNCAILVGVWRALRQARRGDRIEPDALEGLLAGGGLLARLLRRLFRLVSQPWHMYVLGFLFGLG